MTALANARNRTLFPIKAGRRTLFRIVELLTASKSNAVIIPPTTTSATGKCIQMPGRVNRR